MQALSLARSLTGDDRPPTTDHRPLSYLPGHPRSSVDEPQNELAKPRGYRRWSVVGRPPDTSNVGRARAAWLAKGLQGAGILAYRLDDFPFTRSIYEQSLAIWRELGNKQGIARSLHRLGVVVKALGDYELARSLYEQALNIWREIGDKHGTAWTLQSLGYVIYSQGDYALARSVLEESLSMARSPQVGDRWVVSGTLYHLGLVAKAQEDYESARTFFEQTLAIRREMGSKADVAQMTGMLGSVARSLGDYATARLLYQESLALQSELGERYGYSVSLIRLAELAIVEAEVLTPASRAPGELNCEARRDEYPAPRVASTKTRAVSDACYSLLTIGVRLLGAAEALLHELGGPAQGDERHLYERGLATARDLLGEAAFEKARAEGRAMTLEEGVELAESLE